MKSRGLYIVIEGHDGTGKTTQIKLLHQKLLEHGIESVEVEEPAGTPITDELRLIIKNSHLKRNSKTDLLMFSAARCEIWNQKALPALNSGKFVLASRNWWSTEVYQGYASGLDFDLIRDITEKSTDANYMTPDVGIILNLASEQERTRRIAERGALKNPDTFESKNLEFQNKVRDGYLEVAKLRKLPIIDASQSIEGIFKEVWQLVEKELSKRK